jgi:hypothetical protein
MRHVDRIATPGYRSEQAEQSFDVPVQGRAREIGQRLAREERLDGILPGAMLSRTGQAANEVAKDAVVAGALGEIRSPVIAQAKLSIREVKLVGPDPDYGTCDLPMSAAWSQHSSHLGESTVIF